MTNTGAVIQEGSKRSGGVDTLFSSDLGKSPIEQATARANIGVVTAGGVAAVSGEMTPATGIAATDFAAYAHTDGAITGVLFRIVHAGGTYDVSGADSRFGSATSRGVEFASSTGVLTFYADGVAHATTQALTAGSVVISKVLSAATGTLRMPVFFNRALTAAERAAVMRGEVPAALAKVGKQHAMSPQNGYYGLDFSTYSYTGGVISASSTVGARLTFVYVGKVIPGDVIRFSATVTVDQPDSQVFMAIPGDANVATPTAVTAGAFTHDFVVTGTAANAVLFLSSGVSGVTATFSNITVTRIGTVARYEPENVTSLGRWLDSSGNGYDLIPGSGITPLKPQPVQVRFESLVYSTADSVKQKGSWSCFKVRAGVINVIYPTHLQPLCSAYPNNSFISSTAMACLDGFDAACYVVGARYDKTSQYFRILSGSTEVEGTISILFTWSE